MRARIRHLVLCYAVLAVGCGKGCNKQEGPVVNANRPQSGQEGAAEDSVIVLEIVERNTDTFKDQLARIANESSEPAFHIEDGEIVLLDSIAGETDGSKLKAHGLTLGTPGVPLNRCGVLLVYSTVYDGIGREGDSRRYYAFESLPAVIPVPKADTIDKFEFELGRQEGLFELAVNAIRMVGETDGTIEIRKTDDGDKLDIAHAGTSKRLGPGTSADLAEASRTIPVVELPVTAEPIKPGSGPLVEVMPRVDHGPIKFTTKLSVIYHGPLPRVQRKPEPEKEALP